MNTNDFLVEIGTEEIPARFMEAIIKDFKIKTEKWINDLNIPYENINIYGTPRRITLYVTGLASKQRDKEIIAKGPAQNIAYSNGVLTNAGIGFAKSQGITPEQLETREFEGKEYVYAIKQVIGVNTIELLQGIKDVILNLQFPKNMRWGNYDLKFVRPIQWLLALYGEQIVEFSIADQTSSNITYGHRFLSQNKITIKNPSDYLQALLDEFVIVNQERRLEAILKEIKKNELDNNVKVHIDNDLLQEILYLVEYPTAFMGKFDGDFLNIPKEVLITSMREHQRYFPVFDSDNNLQSKFVAIRNGDSRSLDTVIKGNEKVLRARLSDAKFFYDEDKKIAIDDFNEKLKNIVYQKELGTIANKVERITTISGKLATSLRVDEQLKESLHRVAQLCKFDLVTQMVNEFPELQGHMGKEYALLAGETKEVADGLYESYLPRFAGDNVPESIIGSIVSIADKIDTIIGCFGIGIIPTGSQDPYALRRQAAGICHIIKENQLELPLNLLFDITIETYQPLNLLTKNLEVIKNEVTDFFNLRIKNILQEEHIRYDVIDASIVTNEHDILNILSKAKILQESLHNTSFEQIIDTFNRVKNISKHANENVSVDKALFIDEVEGRLYRIYNEKHELVKNAALKRDYNEVMKFINEINPVIIEYFDNVMVMDNDLKIKNNRLALLNQVHLLLLHLGDLSKIVYK